MRLFVVTASIWLAAAASAFGHGDQIQITFNPATGKIETRQIVHTETRPSTLTDPTRVYVMPMLSLTGGAGDGWYVRPNDERNIFGVPLFPTGPGITYQYDPAQLPGTGWSFSGSTTLPNLQGSAFSYSFVDGLKEWSGSNFVDPGDEQLQMFRGDGTSVPSILAQTTDSAPFSTLTLSSISFMSGNPHHSVGFRLLGDGVNPGLTGPAAGDDGIYLASLMVSSSAAGVGASDPFYFVLHKNVDAEAAYQVALTLGFPESQIQVIPEPAALMPMLVVAVAGLRTRRRR